MSSPLDITLDISSVLVAIRKRGRRYQEILLLGPFLAERREGATGHMRFMDQKKRLRVFAEPRQKVSGKLHILSGVGRFCLLLDLLLRYALMHSDLGELCRLRLPTPSSRLITHLARKHDKARLALNASSVFRHP